MNLIFVAVLILFSTKLWSQNKKENVPVSDLEFLYQTLIDNHPKLSLIQERKRFDSLYLETKKGFKNLSRTMAIMHMMKLVASLKDGHTSIARIWDNNAKFHKLPLRFYWFSDGIYISRIDKKYDKYVGMKLVKIGEQTTEKIIEKALPFIHGDNEMAIKNVLPNRLSQYEFLEGLGLSDEPEEIVLTLSDENEKQHILKLSKLNNNQKADYIYARPNTIPSPLYLSKIRQNYWYTFLEKEKVFYFQFNEVSEMDNNPLSNFLKQMFQELASLPVEKMVIDIRLNNGGDNTLLKPLIHGLIRNDKINKKGKLFTVTGRLTFSAAVNLVTELEKHTETIFVGEPTSASPNHYGETQLVPLPTSGIKLLYSSQFWQGSFPWDNREWIAPAMSIDVSIDDYKSGNDPVLNKIIEY